MELPPLQVDIVNDQDTSASVKKQDDDIKHEVSVKSCPVKNVTVFKDRGEVNRIIEIDLIAGDKEVLVTNLASCIDQDSVRVKCYGDATIIEVAYQEKRISDKSLSTEQKKELETESDGIKKVIQDLKDQKTKLQAKVYLASKEKDLLENFSKCISHGKKDKVSEIIASENVENFLSFLSIYEDKNSKLTQEIFDLNKQIEELDKEIVVQNETLKNLAPNKDKVKTSRNVSVLLEVAKSGKITLVLSYIVSNASWTPLYDIRAFNKDSSVQILYFAMIKQNTGEDWEDAKLSLSTAMPSVGGSPPKLEQQTVDILKTYYPKKGRTSFYKRAAPRRSAAMPAGGRNLSLKSAGLMGGASDSEEDVESYSLDTPQALPTAVVRWNIEFNSKKFKKEMMAAKWENSDNPIYRPPAAKYDNPEGDRRSSSSSSLSRALPTAMVRTEARGSFNRPFASFAAPPLLQNYCVDEYDPTIEDSYCGGSVESQPLPTAVATEGITSTSFEIARPATIQSDNIGHKVSICQLDFSPEFEYIATPKLVEHAFLKIKTKNDSTYAMLAGDANVFLDNNFLTKSELPAVSPMEEFEISLGVDPAVKVSYKPVKKFEQTSGMISKSEVYNFHQQIEIKNTKTTLIKIKVTDQCPRSLNEKIKITLQVPEIKIPKTRPNEPTVITHGNATFNTMKYDIDWSCEIEASKTHIIDLRYQIELPKGETLSWK